MQTYIMIALAAAIIAFASCAHAGNGNRDDERTAKPAQYCVPQYDTSGAQRAPYCRDQTGGRMRARSRSTFQP